MSHPIDIIANAHVDLTGTQSRLLVEMHANGGVLHDCGLAAADRKALKALVRKDLVHCTQGWSTPTYRLSGRGRDWCVDRQRQARDLADR